MSSAGASSVVIRESGQLDLEPSVDSVGDRLEVIGI